MKELEENKIGMAGALPPHNFFQFSLCRELGNIGDEKDLLTEYSGFMEVPTEEDGNTKKPDICFKNIDDEVVFLLEITRDLKKEEKKTIEYRKEGNLGEIFVFHYDENRWYSADIDGKLKEGNYSMSFKMHLKKLTDKIQEKWEKWIKQKANRKK